MSAYSEQGTEFKDAGLLCEALREQFKTVHYHETAANLEGYQGDRRADTAEIIIPRSAVGFASNDLGFKRQPNGSYSAIISKFDSSRYNAQWLKNLKVAYAEKFAMSRAAKAGLKFAGKKTVNGKLQLQFIKA